MIRHEPRPWRVATLAFMVDQSGSIIKSPSLIIHMRLLMTLGIGHLEVMNSLGRKYWIVALAQTQDRGLMGFYVVAKDERLGLLPAELLDRRKVYV